MQVNRPNSHPEKRRRQTQRARQLRNSPTEPEFEMWQLLRARRLCGFRFNRQVMIGPFICDFACRSERLIVEIDGASHLQDHVYDRRRTEFLQAKGYRVIRFWNSEVMENPEGVANRILSHLRHTPSPNPSRSREGSQRRPAKAGQHQ